MSNDDLALRLGALECIPPGYAQGEPAFVHGGEARWRSTGKMAFGVTDAAQESTAAADLSAAAEEASDMAERRGASEDEQDKLFEAYSATCVRYDKAKRAYEAQPRRFLFAGPPGVGKTVSATALYRHLVERMPIDVLFNGSAAPLWIDAFALGQADAKILARVETATVLCFDDLGREAILGRSAVARTVGLLRARHANEVFTIVTTGWTDEQIAAEYGADVLRRLTDRAAIIRWTEGDK